MDQLRPNTPKSGDPVSPAQFDSVAKLAAFGAQLSVDPTSGMQLIQTPGKPLLSNLSAATMDARITGFASGAYAWQRVTPIPGGGWVDEGPSGTTTDDPAYERSGSATVPTDGTAIVPMERECGEWRFDWRACST